MPNRTPTPAAGPAAEIDAFLARQNAKDQLRFVICGSVDDGKSTLLGRLLYDSQAVFEDQIAAAAAESRTYGTQPGAVDLALLIDGLQAEREQGITIDVAWRYFETATRKFIAADAPGHEQYTRNMVTGASTAELAVILVDARKGMLTQTRRHLCLAALMGVGHAVLAVNKMDLVGHDAGVFGAIRDEFAAFAGRLGIAAVDAVPLSALSGDNVVTAGRAMPWYDGPPLLRLLETVEVRRPPDSAGFRLPVQRVNRPDDGFRGFSGTVAAGRVALGMAVTVCPSGAQSTVSRILDPSGDQNAAIAGQAVTLVLGDAVDVSRGDMIAARDRPPGAADQFATHLIWMDEQPMLPERAYLARFASAIAVARVTDLVHRLDMDGLDRLAAKTLGLNEVGYCKLALDRAVPFDPYAENRQTGAFILIDRFTNATVAAGMIGFALRRSANIVWHEMKVDKQARARATGQRPRVLWLTGLSGAGKSTIADRLEQKLMARGHHTYLLDGDNVRHGLNRDLGFTEADRVENIRRVAEVARLMVDAGLIVIVAFISPFRSERQMARELLEAGEFVEIFVDAPLELCEARDPKGLYGKARRGELANFTGIDSPYEPPEAPELRLDTAALSAEAAADAVLALLTQMDAG